MTALLNESERDAARLAQLNAALKAEIRRLSASLPAEGDTQNNNNAYLKNVVFKVNRISNYLLTFKYIFGLFYLIYN